MIELAALALVFLAVVATCGRAPLAALVLVVLMGAARARAAGVDVSAAAAVVAKIRPGQVHASIGIPGTGKTKTVQTASRAWRRVVTFDPFAAIDRRQASRGGFRGGWDGHLVNVLDLLHQPELLDRANLRLVVTSSAPDKRTMGRDFSTLASLCWHTGNLVLVAEECGAYSRDAHELVFRIASGGRHAGLSLVLVCQSLTRITIDGRRHITSITAGAQGEPADLDALRARCGRTFTERVRALKADPPDPPIAWRLGEGVAESSS